MTKKASPYKVPRLEIRAAEHCNLSCRGCAQLSPYQLPSFPDLNVLRNSLTTLSNVLEADSVHILGGEPLLNPDIEALLDIVVASRIAPSVSITTNGLLLGKCPDGLWAKISEVEISVYPSTVAAIKKLVPSLLEKAVQFSTSLCLLGTPTFRHIVLSTPVEPANRVLDVYRNCYYKDYTTTVHNGYLYRCAPCINISSGIHSHRLDPADRLKIEAPYLDSGAVEHFLKQDTPMAACKYCLGTSGTEFDHSQMPRTSKAEFDNPFYESKYRIEPDTSATSRSQKCSQ